MRLTVSIEPMDEERCKTFFGIMKSVASRGLLPAERKGACVGLGAPVILRVLKGLPSERARALSQVRYSAYVVAEPLGRAFFAGEATEIPSLEGAIFSAHRAAQEVRELFSKGE